MQEAVEAVIHTLGMQPCEGTEAVPPNARSHTVLLAGVFVGNQQVRGCTCWLQALAGLLQLMQGGMARQGLSDLCLCAARPGSAAHELWH